MSSLRILHVVPYFEDAWAYGGIPRVATAMTRGLARRGHHVTVCTTDACDAHTRLDPSEVTRRAGGLDVRVFPNVSNHLAYHYQAFAPRGLRRFLRHHAASFDVAHLHACRNLPVSIAGHELQRAGVPYVLSPNGTAPLIERRLLLKRLFDAAGGRRVIENADCVIATSEAECRQLIETGIDRSRVSVVPNPLDIGEFSDLPPRDMFRRTHGLGDSRLVLFLGKITPRKGVDVLVEAFGLVTASGAQLVIAGNDMGVGTGVEFATADPVLQGRMTRVGLLRGRDRLEALVSADVVVYPSKDEVFGLVPLEALLCGTPVVVSNDSGCGEIIRRTGGGHIVPYGDRPALAAAIDAILKSPAIWRTHAATAGRKARELFAAEVVCDHLENLYARIARARDHRRSVA
jgi:glycosyltransferase involved in cell wall biosynthesis